MGVYPTCTESVFMDRVLPLESSAVASLFAPVNAEIPYPTPVDLIIHNTHLNIHPYGRSSDFLAL